MKLGNILFMVDTRAENDKLYATIKARKFAIPILYAIALFNMIMGRG